MFMQRGLHPRQKNANLSRSRCRLCLGMVNYSAGSMPGQFREIMRQPWDHHVNRMIKGILIKHPISVDSSGPGR